MFSKLAAFEVSKHLNMDQTEAWIPPPSLGRTRTPEFSHTLLLHLLSLYTLIPPEPLPQWGRPPSAERRCSAASYNRAGKKLHPPQFQDSAKKTCVFLKCSFSPVLWRRSGGADSPYLSHSWRRLVLEQGVLNRRPGLVHWSALFPVVLTVFIKLCVCACVRPPASDAVFSVMTEVKKWRNETNVEIDDDLS